ncbi:hypothetical protein ACFPM3_18315 [Streptomyces coeruleoprunus]|uniref:Acyl-CoA dehydrogenase/oxidase C-terminal domain-containing protein n=1 Tax=Streptomyces coeruleoprunus TaxID=285563 RepID=A0ABV9XH67_9ACTN
MVSTVSARIPTPRTPCSCRPWSSATMPGSAPSANKYYAEGVGFIREVMVGGGTDELDRVGVGKP